MSLSTLTMPDRVECENSIDDCPFFLTAYRLGRDHLKGMQFLTSVKPQALHKTVYTPNGSVVFAEYGVKTGKTNQKVEDGFMTSFNESVHVTKALSAPKCFCSRYRSSS
jgi:hypothetical protein